MEDNEYKQKWIDLWYCDYFWIWGIAKKEMYDQWPYTQSTANAYSTDPDEPMIEAPKEEGKE